MKFAQSLPMTASPTTRKKDKPNQGKVCEAMV
jgi:hypothetical protein